MSNFKIVVLPAPVWPMTPRNWPPATEKEIPLSTFVEVFGYVKCTFLNSIDSIGPRSAVASSASTIVGSKSIAAKTRRAAASPRCS